MEIVTTIDFEQYKAAVAALRIPGGAQSKVAGSRYWGIGISFFITLSFLLSDASHNSLKKPTLVIGGVAAMYGLHLLLMYWSRSRYSACLKRIYEAQEEQLCGQPMSITKEGISGKSADLTYSYTYQWASFVRLIDVPDGLLFLPNAVSFVRIPKASLSPEDVRQIVEWWTPYAQRTNR